MRWILHRHIQPPSVVIDIVDIQGVTAGKTKDHSPVRPHGHRPKALERSLEWMKPKPWQVHVRSCARGIEPRKNVAQFFCVFPRNSTRVVPCGGSSRPSATVTRHVTDVKIPGILAGRDGVNAVTACIGIPIACPGPRISRPSVQTREWISPKGPLGVTPSVSVLVFRQRQILLGSRFQIL